MAMMAPEEEMMAEEEMPMEEPMAEEMPEEEAPVEGELSPEEEQVAAQMEQLMGNYLDLEEADRKRAQTLIMSPAADLMDKVLGVPLFTRIRTQIETSMGDAQELPASEEAPVEEPTGIMAETEAPAEDMPMEDEELV